MIPARHGGFNTLDWCMPVCMCVRALSVPIGIKLLTMRDMLYAVHAQIYMIFFCSHVTAIAVAFTSSYSAIATGAACG